MKDTKNYRKFSKFIGFPLVLLLFGYVFYKLFSNLKELKTYSWHLNPIYALAGIILIFLTNSTMPFIWHNILKNTGENVSKLRVYYAWVLSRLGRYIPGKVWMIFGRVYLVPGSKKAVLLWTIGIELLLDILAGTSIAFLTFPFIAKSLHFKTWPASPWILVATLALVIIFLNPSFVQWVLSKYYREKIEVTWHYGHLISWFFLYASMWFSRMLAHWLFIISFGIKITYLQLTSAFATSWILGLITPFAPGGLGIREGFITYMLSGVVGEGIAPLIALLTRILSILGEILMVIPALILRNRIKGK